MIFILFFYLAFIVVYIIFSVIAIYHLFRFGYVGDLTKPVIFIYSFLSVAIIVTTLIIILLRQWPVTFNL